MTDRLILPHDFALAGFPTAWGPLGGEYGTVYDDEPSRGSIATYYWKWRGWSEPTLNEATFNFDHEGELGAVGGPTGVAPMEEWLEEPGAPVFAEPTHHSDGIPPGFPGAGWNAYAMSMWIESGHIDTGVGIVDTSVRMDGVRTSVGPRPWTALRRPHVYRPVAGDTRDHWRGERAMNFADVAGGAAWYGFRLELYWARPD